MTNNDLHNTKRKLKIEQHEPHGGEQGAPEG